LSSGRSDRATVVRPEPASPWMNTDSWSTAERWAELSRVVDGRGALCARGMRRYIGPRHPHRGCVRS
jgi:hypothetical protein